MNTRKTFVFRLSRLVSAAVLLTLACFAFSPRLANAQGFLFEPAHPRPLPRIIHTIAIVNSRLIIPHFS